MGCRPRRGPRAAARARRRGGGAFGAGARAILARAASRRPARTAAPEEPGAPPPGPGRAAIIASGAARRSHRRELQRVAQPAEPALVADAEDHPQDHFERDRLHPRDRARASDAGTARSPRASGRASRGRTPMRSPWNGGSIRRRSRRCRGPSRSSSELGPRTDAGSVRLAGVQHVGVAGEDLAPRHRGGPSITHGGSVPILSVNASPYSRQARNMNGPGRAVHATLWARGHARAGRQDGHPQTLSRRDGAQGEQLVGDRRRQHRGRLAGPVVGRRDLDEVEARERSPASARRNASASCGSRPATSGVPVAGANAGSNDVDVEDRKSGPSPRARAQPAGTRREQRAQRVAGEISKPSSRGSARSAGPYSGPRMPASVERSGAATLLERAPERASRGSSARRSTRPRCPRGRPSARADGPRARRARASSPRTIEWSPPSTSGVTPAATSCRGQRGSAPAVRSAFPGVTSRSPRSTSDLAREHVDLQRRVHGRSSSEPARIASGPNPPAR